MSAPGGIEIREKCGQKIKRFFTALFYTLNVHLLE